MADRGFKNLEPHLTKVNATLIRPPSVGEGEVLDAKTSQEAKRIAALRIHVERSIGRLRQFSFLAPHATIPHQLQDCVNDAVMIACGLKGYMFHITEEVNHSVEKDVEVRLCGIPVSVFIDSGATVNVIDKKTWGYLKERRVKGECVADKKPLYAYCATAPLPVLGRFDAEISIDKNCINALFYVIDCDGSPLMGMQTAIDLGVLLMGKNFKNTGDSIVSDPSFHNIMNESHNKRAQCRTSFQQHRAVSATVRHIGKIPQREEMVSAREHDTRVASYARATCKVNASSIVQSQREEGQPAKLAPTQAVVTDHAWRPQRAWRRCLH
ncbi:hypothetical protein B566_EDAN006771 [Ephemera danica]|nr:hypothetical protein B566_EDAN006771 [Ephemera danica]